MQISTLPMGNFIIFTTASVVPFSVKSGNPNAFGLNLIQVEGSQDDASSDTNSANTTASGSDDDQRKSRSYQSG